MYLGGGEILYPVYRDRRMPRPMAVLTDHTRLDQASEAGAEERTRMLWVELVEIFLIVETGQWSGPN
jgi:hypothetical protein